MKPKKIPPGHVVLEWRMSAAWRDDTQQSMRWGFYAHASPKDAEEFMAQKAPHAVMFEFRINKGTEDEWSV